MISRTEAVTFLGGSLMRTNSPDQPTNAPSPALDDQARTIAERLEAVRVALRRQLAPAVDDWGEKSFNDKGFTER